MFRFLEEIIWGKKCEICGFNLNYSEEILCGDCEKKFDSKLRIESMDGVKVLFAYSGIVRSLILRGKYKFNKRLWQVWEKWIKNFRVPDGNNLVLYVPMTWGRFCFRGFNQSLLLAKSFERHGFGEVRRVLKRKNFCKSSSLMSREERFESMRDVFEVGDESLDVDRWDNVLIMDDVLTTGATFQALEDVLVEFGFKKKQIYKFALASGRLKD